MNMKIMARGADGGITEFWMNDDIVRVGSAADCDLPVAGIAPHALTVQQRAGRFYLFNRSGAPLRVDGQILGAGHSSEWTSGQEVDCGGGAALVLQSAEPQTQAPLAFDDEADADAENQAGQKDNGKLMLILGLCVVGILYFLTAGANASSRKSTTVRFESMVEEFNWEHADGNATSRRVLDLLQRARVAELRGDESQAKKAYAEVKDLLWTEKQSGSPSFFRSSRDQGNIDQQTLDFVTERLPRL